MPNIPTYNTPEAEWKLNVPEGGSSALASAGLRVGRGGQEAANTWERGANELARGINTAGKTIEAQQTQSEIGKAPLLIAKDQSARLDDLHNISMTTDPSQITGRIGQYVDENMGDAKSAYMSNFTTPAAKAHAETLWNQHEVNIYNHASAVSEQASLDQNHNQLVGAVNTFAATAGDHPSTLDVNLGNIDSTIDTHLNTLPKDQRTAFGTTFRQEAKEKALAAGLKSVAFGSPDGSLPPNPELAKTMLDSGKYDDIIGQNRDKFDRDIRLADGLVKQNAATNAAHADTVAQQRSDATAGQYFNQLPTVSGQATDPNFGTRVLHDPNILPDDKVALMNVSTKLASGPAPTTNAMTMDHMITRLTSADKPSTAQLLNQVSAGNLGLADAQFLMGQDPNSPALHQLRDTLNNGKTALTLNPGSGLHDPSSATAYERFQQFAVNAYKNGAPIDAKQMPDVLAQFKPTHQDAAAAAIQASGGTMVPGGVLSRPPTDKMLPFISATESSDRNITNPTATSSGRAEGHYQITTGTWKDFAPKAGVSLAEYPTAISAPKSVQAQVAKTIPLRRWDPNTIRYLAQKGALG